MLTKWDLLVACVMALHVAICPFTKVEESFNVQAVHDFFFLRGEIEKFDHLHFPGVVPRTSLGALCVAILSAPFVFISQASGLPKLSALVVSRVILGLLVVLSLAKFRSSAERVFGVRLGFCFAATFISQFHFLFYASRPLPNTFALVIVLWAFASWLAGSRSLMIWSCALAGLVFRSELILLLGPIMILDLASTSRSLASRLLTYTKHASLAALVFLGMSLFRNRQCSVLIGILFSGSCESCDIITGTSMQELISFVLFPEGLTILVDSFFWRRWLWPEGEVLWYNTVLNKSSNWGTMPFLWYFYSALPRSLLGALPLAVVGVAVTGRRLAKVVAVALVFVLLYSFLPHKELRFIIYAVPLFNLAAALGLKWMWDNQSYRLLMRFFCVACIGGGIIASAGFTYISHHNYPGGVALQRLQQTLQPEGHVYVHICNAAAQSGVSRFGEENSTWSYSKKENLKAGDALLPYSHIIVEANDAALYRDTHKQLFAVQGFSRLQWRKAPRGVLLEDKLVVLQRNTPILDRRKLGR